MKSKFLLTLSIILLIGTLLWTYRLIFVKSTPDANPKILIEQNFISITEELSKNINLQTSKVFKTTFSTKIELLGETEAVPDSIIDVPSRISGRVTSVYFVEGDRIKKGQVMATIDSPELTKLRSTYMTAKTKYIASEQNYERIKSLVQMNLAAKQDLVDAESNLKVIRAERTSAEETLRVNGLGISDSMSGIYNVVAPKTGLVIFRNVTPGSQIAGNQTLATIADLKELWFQGKIFEGDLQFLKEGDSAKVTLNAYPGDFFPGILNHIGEKVDPISRTIHARIAFKNSESKGKIGLFGKAYIEISPRQGIKIPTIAIQALQDKKYIFVKRGKLKYEWKEIETGSQIELETEIKSGLEEGDEILTNGSFELKAIFFKTTFGEE